MKALPTLAAASSLILASAAAVAQTTAPAPGAPADKQPAAPSAAAPSTAQPDYKMTDAEAGAWVNKTVYSSDNKSLGEVAAIQRDSSGKVTELHADIGGFLGIGETRVRVMPGQFKFNGDNIVLNMTAEQARQLPKMGK